MVSARRLRHRSGRTGNAWHLTDVLFDHHPDRRPVYPFQSRRERSIARNTGAAVSRGRYLHFLVDDDWLLPEALAELRTLARQSREAAWLYGGLRVVDETGRILGEANSGLNGNCLAQIVGGAWAPLQATLIRTDVFFREGSSIPS